MDVVWSHKSADANRSKKLEQALECSPTLAQLLLNRDISCPDQARSFLHPSFENLRDPFCLKDMDIAVERITTAIANREKILIFGDYDADGVTATTLVNDFLTHADAEVSWYIPHRINEGYSLKPQHILMAAEQNIDVIITVDCGSDSNEAVLLARKEDIDVIITDHHEVGNSPPQALALINPKRGDCTGGLEHLAGVGVAFYLIIALRQHLRNTGFWEDRQEPNLRNYCDLVALGTIADMVPLKNENRILSVSGIEVMRGKNREGFNALADVSRIDLDVIDSDDISYRIAPRINAAGRISHARICVNLLSAREKNSADQTASILDQLNRKRQQTEQSIVEDIERQLAHHPERLSGRTIVLWDESWNPGVLGIAAAKTMMQYAKPVVLISTSRSPASGSCRSTGCVNIHKCLSACSHLLKAFGGHAMAAGLSLAPEDLDRFKETLEQAVIHFYPLDDFRQELSIDCELDLDSITEDLVREIDMLRPYGTGNPEPLFSCSNIRVISSAIIGTNHRKMIVEQTGSSTGTRIEALRFNLKNTLDLPVAFDQIAFKLKMNRYPSKPCPQIIIEYP
ncbi:MAG: single-stranded-DNA-specific exonuclease RecJ [Pseudomonadota bacterium]